MSVGYMTTQKVCMYVFQRCSLVGMKETDPHLVRAVLLISVPKFYILACQMVS